MTASLASLLLMGASVASAAPVKVLPLGDSITFGCGDGCNGMGCGDQCAVLRPACQSGYRAPLWRKLSPGGNTSDDWVFVGTQFNGPEDTNRAHEGHPGWTNEEDMAISKNWLPLNPDVILLHLGTNNMGVVGHQQAPAAIGHMGALLNITFAALPKVRLLLSTLVGSGVEYGGKQHAAYNAGLKQFAVDYKQKGFNIELVDMDAEAGLGTYCDNGDCCPLDVHPNEKGYIRMADVWYKHLTGKGVVVV